MSGWTEIDLARFVDDSCAQVRAMKPHPPDENYHVTWTLPVPVEASERDIELVQQELSRRFPAWTVEAIPVRACGWIAVTDDG